MKPLFYTALLGFTLLFACAQEGNKIAAGPEVQAESYRNIPAAESGQLLTQDPEVVILDVRTPEEFGGGHLQNAQNIDFNAPEFAGKLNALDRKKTYLVYCAAGGRSQKAAALMQEQGFAHVYNCTNGFTDLQQTGVPVE